MSGRWVEPPEWSDRRLRYCGRMEQVRRIVLTGGDHAGKTTLVEAFRARGYTVVPEAALQEIEALNRELGVAGQRAWRQAHWTEFQARVARRQHALEARALDSGARAIVLDRGLPDGIAYCRLAGAGLPPELQDGLERRYDQVWLLDTVTPFAARTASGRLGGLERSTALRDLLGAVYRELGYAPEPLAHVPVEERLSRVLARLEQPER